MADTLFDGQHLPALTIIDNFTRKRLSIKVAEPQREGMVRMLERITYARGLPAVIKSTKVWSLF